MDETLEGRVERTDHQRAHRFPTFTIFGPLSRERLAADQIDLISFCRKHSVHFVLDFLIRDRFLGINPFLGRLMNPTSSER